ncbi:hypothetical protein ACSSS7_005620 [Eimeria intestinalis]
MESYLNRANAVFCGMLVCMGALAIGNIASSSFLTAPISGTVTGRDVYGFGYNYVLGGDQAALSLDVKVDLRGLFQWNAKQLFLFVSAEYETPQHRNNQVVIYDKIISREEDAMLDLVNIPSKYHLRDKGRGLRGRAITLKLQVVYHPIVGRMTTQVLHTSSFRIPAQYDRVTVKQQQERQQSQVQEAAKVASAEPDDIA